MSPTADALTENARRRPIVQGRAKCHTVLAIGSLRNAPSQHNPKSYRALELRRSALSGGISSKRWLGLELEFSVVTHIWQVVLGNR